MYQLYQDLLIIFEYSREMLEIHRILRTKNKANIKTQNRINNECGIDRKMGLMNPF